VVKATPGPLNPRERPCTRCRGGLAGPGTGEENLASIGIRSLDRPARIQSLYRLRHLSPPIGMHRCKWQFIILSETLSPVFPILASVEEFLEQLFISRGNITDGNVYRPHTHAQARAVRSTRRLSQCRQYLKNNYAIFRGKLENFQGILSFFFF
jgi:hypothetical protein